MWGELRKYLFSRYLNLLLVFVPGVFLMEYVWHAGPVWLFIASALAIIPLAGVLGDATEEVAGRMGPVAGGLLSGTLGNATASGVPAARPPTEIDVEALAKYIRADVGDDPAFGKLTVSKDSAGRPALEVTMKGVPENMLPDLSRTLRAASLQEALAGRIPNGDVEIILKGAS